MHDSDHAAIFHLERQLQKLNEDLTARILNPSERKQVEAKIQLTKVLLDVYHLTLDEGALHSGEVKASR